MIYHLPIYITMSTIYIIICTLYLFSYILYINKWEEWKSWNTNYCGAAEIYKSITFLKIGEFIPFLKMNIKVCMREVCKSIPNQYLKLDKFPKFRRVSKVKNVSTRDENPHNLRKRIIWSTVFFCVTKVLQYPLYKHWDVIKV